MTISPEQIASLLQSRMAEAGPLHQQMRRMSKHYNSDIAIPLPEMDENEEPAVANFVAQAIDAHAMRIASPGPPVIDAPATVLDEPGYERAKKRRLAAYGWFDRNGYALQLRRRARFLVAYASSPVIIAPDPKTMSVTWDVRSPLDYYPSRRTSMLDFNPCDAIFTYTQTYGYLQATNQQGAAAVNVKSGHGLTRDSVIQMAMYLDDQETVVVAWGSTAPWKATGYPGGPSMSGTPYLSDLSQYWNHTEHTGGNYGGGTWAVELSRVPNLIGRCPVVSPYRLSLDNPRGQFDDTTGLWQMYAKMMALYVNSSYRGVYPETWLVVDPNTGGEVVTPADGLAGDVGVVRGASLQQITQQPGIDVGQAIDRLERATKINGSLSSEVSGESGTNIRTDRRGNSIQAAQMDFHIDEHQHLFAASAQVECELAGLIERTYYGDEPHSFYIRGGKKPGNLSYVPNDIFTESTTYVAKYPYAGLDLGQLTVTLEQQVGGGSLSARSAMEALNTVDDPDLEFDRIDQEAVHKGMVGAVMQQVAAGTITLPDAARMEGLMLREGKTLGEAIEIVQKEAQERQASQTPDGQDDTVPPGAPEAQPGLALPGQGQEQPTGPPGAGPIQGNDQLNQLRQNLNQLRARSAVPA